MEHTSRINKKRRSLKNGLTLIETLVAITILLLAIAGPLTLATRSLLAAIVARDQLTASYLAQDAVEYIRYRRDNNFLNGVSWSDGIFASCLSPNTCEVDTATDDVTQCSGDCRQLLYNETSGFFGYNNGDPTQFRRSISISPVGGQSWEAVVDVTVSWQTGIFTRSFTTRENILNWLGT